MVGSDSKAREKRTQRDYSLAFKLQVVSEVERGELSYKESQRKYGIQGRSTVLVWLRKHGTLEWKKRSTSMDPKKKPSPQTEINRLKRELELAKAETAVMQIAFDIAEKELGVDLRKKYLTKLSGKVDNKGHLLESGESVDCLA